MATIQRKTATQSAKTGSLSGGKVAAKPAKESLLDRAKRIPTGTFKGITKLLEPRERR